MTPARDLDEAAVTRESPVRRAHSAAARRHGRASAPGYLGVPIEEARDAERVAQEADDEAYGDTAGQDAGRAVRPDGERSSEPSGGEGDEGARSKPRTRGEGRARSSGKGSGSGSASRSP